MEDPVAELLKESSRESILVPVEGISKGTGGGETMTVTNGRTSRKC